MRRHTHAYILNTCRVTHTHTNTNSVEILCIYSQNEQNNMRVCRSTVRVAPIHKCMYQHHRHPCRTTHIRCTCGHTTDARMPTCVHTTLKRTLPTYVLYTWIHAKVFACTTCKQNTCAKKRMRMHARATVCIHSCFKHNVHAKMHAILHAHA